MTRSSAIFLVAFAFPGFVTASSLNTVTQDAASFSTVLQQMQSEQNAQAADQMRENDSEIFPSTGQGGSSSNQSALSEDPVFLTVRVDGVPVIFHDVPKESWFAPYVRDVTGQGIVSGYREADGTLKGLFGPADQLTIEQLAKVAVQVGHVDTAGCGSSTRNGAVRGTWSEPFVRCAEQRGWAVYADGSVDARRQAKRSEVVATLLQALGVKIEQRTGGVFKDVDGSVEFAAAIEMAAKAGVVAGDTDVQGNPTGTFRPLDSVNRAEVAKMITLAVQIYGG